MISEGFGSSWQGQPEEASPSRAKSLREQAEKSLSMKEPEEDLAPTDMPLVTPTEESPSTREHRAPKDMLSVTHFLQPEPTFHCSATSYRSTHTLNLSMD